MKVLAVAGDAGGARAIAPAIRALGHRSGYTVECRAYAAATDIWTRAGFDPRAIEPMEDFSFDRVLLGTSMGKEQWELEVIRKAARCKVRSISMLDLGVHCRERFTAPDGAFVLPDVIAVIDEQVRQAMIALGFPPERLAVTGHPGFDELAGCHRPETVREAALRLRLLAGCPDDELCLLYASQPLSQLVALQELGFDENGVLDAVVAILGRVLERRSRRATLLVKLHPREAKRNFSLPAYHTPRLSLKTAADEMEPWEMALGSDLVIGMNSMLLMEACLLGKAVVSYQPGLRITDPLPCNRQGWSRAVYRRSDLEGALDAELFDAQTRAMRREILAGVAFSGGATERLVELLHVHTERPV